MSTEQQQEEVFHEREEREEETRKEKKCCCCPRLVCLFITGLVTCCICLVIAVGLGVTYDLKENLLFFVANKELSLTRGSLMTDAWVNLPAQPSVLYFFNITNPHDIQHKGAKPNVEEIGPFYYKKKRNITDLYWNKYESLVTYSTEISYTDNLNQSIDDPRNIKVTSLNIPLIGLLKLYENIETEYKDWKLILETIFRTEDWINEIFNYEPLFITKTIEELAFGYEDPIYKLVHELDPTLLPNANFSIRSRHKVEEHSTVYTGKNESLLRGEYYIWNGLHEISGWNSPTAKMINGTDASIFHTNISRNESLYSFTNDFQRSAYFSYDCDEDVGKLFSYRYKFPYKEMDTSLMDPGFNPYGPSGVFNLTAVSPLHIPIFVSKPHFLDADKQFINNVTGLSPNRTLHDSYLNVEPITGITVRGAKRIQLNVQIEKKKQFIQLRHLRDLTVLPIFYVADEAIISDKQSDMLHNIILYTQGSLNIGLPVIIGVAGVIFILTFICQLIIAVRLRREYLNRKQSQRRTAEPLINEHTPLLQ